MNDMKIIKTTIVTYQTYIKEITKTGKWTKVTINSIVKYKPIPGLTDEIEEKEEKKPDPTPKVPATTIPSCTSKTLKKAKECINK